MTYFSCVLGLVAISVVISQVSAGCVMVQPCLPTDKQWKDHNCYKPKPAGPFPAEEVETFAKLQEICPRILTKGKDTPVCCSPYQVQNLARRFQFPDLLIQRCPACHLNFRSLFCEFACSPVQDDFLVAPETFTQDGHVVVKEWTYYINKTFADNTFRSCRNVQAFFPGTKVMDAMCGESKDCNVQDFLDFLGTSIANGGFAPFQINHKLVDGPLTLASGKEIISMTTPTYKCSEPAGKDNKRCSCTDCKEPMCSKEDSKNNL